MNRRKKLEDSRHLCRFSQSIKEEISFIQEKTQLAASKEVGKDLVGLTRLQKKHQVINSIFFLV